MRRLVLSLGVLGLAVLCVRRVHASDGDESSASAGFSASEHDAHLTCGPDVRVRHASAGVQVHKVFGEGDGQGWVLDARGGVGSTEVTHVYSDTTASAGSPLAGKRSAASGQAMFGYAWRSFGFAVGAGYFGAVDGAYKDDNRTRWALLPTTSLRIGRGAPFRMELGLGAPPLAGMARHFSLYADAQFLVDPRIVAGLGTYATLQTDLERRSGLYARGGYHVTPAVQLGGFLGAESLLDNDRRVGYAGGVGATWYFDR